MNYKVCGFVREEMERVRNQNKLDERGGDEGEVVELDPNMFWFVVDEFENRRNVVGMLEEFRKITEVYLRFYYFEEFRKSGMCRLVVQNLDSENGDLSVIMWEIVVNLVSFSENVDYANDLIELGLFEQAKFILEKLDPSIECNHYVFYCIANLANISVSIRDQVMINISSDLILYYLQNSETPISTIKIILKLLCRLMFDDIDEIQYDYIFSILIQTSEFLESESKQKLYLQCLFLLSNNKKYIFNLCNANEYQNIFTLINHPNEVIKIYIIGFALNVIDTCISNLVRFTPDFITNIHSTSDKVVFGLGSILTRIMQLTPDTFNPSMICDLLHFILTTHEHFSIETKKCLYHFMLSLIGISSAPILSDLLSFGVVQTLLDITLIEDEDLTISSISQLHRLFEHDELSTRLQLHSAGGPALLLHLSDDCTAPQLQHLLNRMSQ